MSNLAVSAENLSKKYRLGVINRRMLVDQIESWLCRKLGRPDPHASVFEKATDRMPTPYDFWALKDVTFEIKKGDIVGVMGRNGSGKSTLLKLLSRITAPTKGNALLNGRVASLLEVGTGFNFELTGKENVYLNGSILGLKQKEIDSRYERIVDFAEIPDFMDTPVKRYSSGMRVRLAFSVAAHLDPEILILDEVLAVGDAKFQDKCLNRINDIKNSGVTILFVSHSTESVLKLCSRGILLHEGKLVCHGDVHDVVRNYKDMLGLDHGEETPAGVRESYVGIYSGNIAKRLLQEFPDGQIAFDVPVETSEGLLPIDLGWVSNSRLQSLRTRPTWSGAPDLSICVVSKDRSEAEANRSIGLLMRAGATEVWIVMPDGEIRRFLIESRNFMGSGKMGNAMAL
jgi:ABC-type polysaccharide/polyol phosphate transport system ATPase subunit